MPLLLAAGLAACAGAGLQGAPAKGDPTGDLASPLPTATPQASPGVGDDVSLSDAGLPTLLPDVVRQRVPTRVLIRDLGIDLPVIAPPGEAPGRFPLCNVAEFLPSMSRPGRPGTTFVYAHARAGMFLPILEASRLRDGRSMVGMRVDVFTSDGRRFTYEVASVLRHVDSLEFAYRETAEQLVLQTSEGPRGTVGKTMLVARPVAESAASTNDAHPEVRPVACA